MTLRDKLGHLVVERHAAGDLLLDGKQDVDAGLVEFFPVSRVIYSISWPVLGPRAQQNVLNSSEDWSLLDKLFVVRRASEFSPSLGSGFVQESHEEDQEEISPACHCDQLANRKRLNSPSELTEDPARREQSSALAPRLRCLRLAAWHVPPRPKCRMASRRR